MLNNGRKVCSKELTGEDLTNRNNRGMGSEVMAKRKKRFSCSMDEVANLACMTGTRVNKVGGFALS